MPASSRFLVLGLIAALTACGGDGSDPQAEKEPMETHAHTNRLIHEKSPYLLQHAHNPVDWYPWGEEALDRARTEDKPIFLSVGYSTCHWCHVMEHESFENEEIAAYLNAHFVPVKVDREERPDLDALYMTAVQGMTGSGGWPMSVFLTPELKPFFAGTYFPPEDAYGRPGFRTLLNRIAEAWTTERDALETQGERTVEFIRSRSGAVRSDGARAALTDSLLVRAYQQVASGYDARLGGFGRAPKFPIPHKLTFLLRYAERTADPDERASAREMVRGTLDAMAAGGIHDHLGGGFHRYSTDERWLAPHFEKMLYDQAGLALAYLSGWLVTKEERYAAVARDILDYTLRDLGHPGGGFYAAEDADSEGEEGTFYVWSASEIDAVLGEDGPEFRKAYGVTDTGNWEGKNILHLREFDPAVAATWAGARARLKAVRDERIRPHRDEKIIVAWNGFMIEAMARAGAAIGEPRYLDGAVRAAEFIEANLYRDGRLMRHHREGTAQIGAFQEDYAFLSRGYLALYEATFEARWLERAVALAREMDRLFAREGGGYQVAGNDAEALLAPVVEIYDGAMPSGNSVAAVGLLTLGHLTADAGLKARGWEVLETFLEEMASAPAAHLELLSGLDFALGPNTEIVVAGDAADANVKSMLSEIRARYLPNGVWAWRPSGSGDPVLGHIPYLEAQTAIEGRATAYVCRDYACRLPVHLASDLATQLDER